MHGALVHSLSEASGGDVFRLDHWQSELGSGISAIAERDALWDRAFVGFSQVGGERLPAAASDRKPHLANLPWQAVGVSLVVHPASPLVPATHLNLRFFSVDTVGPDRADGGWWFGGGFDLTPCYPEEEDCRLWHQAAHDAVEPFLPGLYAEFKAACDSYFYLPHRGEMRGIGGIFFDDFDRLPFDQCLQMSRAVGEKFQQAYLALVQKHRSRPFSTEQKAFQLLRRGRYAEFNLAFDRGTRFGLNSGGRTQSILASLPPEACWSYETDSCHRDAEAELLPYLSARNWLEADAHAARKRQA